MAECVEGRYQGRVTQISEWEHSEYWDSLGGGNIAVVELRIYSLRLRDVENGTSYAVGDVEFPPIAVGGHGE